jgi:hypothetical protein
MLRRSFALLTCGLSLSLVPSSSATAQLDSAALLQRFEPVLLFRSDEDWSPEPADGFVGRARVEKQVARGTWASAPPPLPVNTSGCAFTPCYRFNLPCALRSGDACYEASRPSITDWTKPVIYGRVLSVPAGSPAPPGFSTPPRYLVRYWLFYDFDDWRSPRRRLWQAHEADWESVTIGLSATLQPQFAAYSQHCSGTIRAWANVAKRGDTHPVDYIALGSHAPRASSSSRRTGSSTAWAPRIGPGLAVSQASRPSRSSSSRLRFRPGPPFPAGGAKVSSSGSARLRAVSRASPRRAARARRTGTAPRSRPTGTRLRARPGAPRGT